MKEKMARFPDVRRCKYIYKKRNETGGGPRGKMTLDNVEKNDLLYLSKGANI